MSYKAAAGFTFGGIELLTVIACIIAADFITGLIHWWEDTYGLPTWPILGKHVVLPNIDHHRRPNAIGSMSDWISRNYQTVVPMIVVASGLGYAFGWAIWPVVLTLALASLGNEVHTWNHRHDNGRLVSFLQDSGLVQTRVQHGRHHKPPYDCYYCTLTNFTNAVLERVQFWRGLEWIVFAVLGVQPKRCSPERGGF